MAEVEQEQGDKVIKEELQYGPAPNRGCTDAWCLLVLLAAWVAYVVVTIAGIADGNPSKLYLPRDYKGDYCEAATNWNNGPDLTNFPKLSYTMNASSILQGTVKQTLCSTAVKNIMTLGTDPILPYTFNGNIGPTQMEYLSACCLMPNSACSGSFEVGGDISTVAEVDTIIQAKMAEITGAGDTAAAELFSANGANGEMFQDMWSDAFKYFNAVCLKDCNQNFDTMEAGDDKRNWTFQLSKDDPLYTFWEDLKDASASAHPSISTQITQIQSLITDSFVFDALPRNDCPYTEKYCIPMPGLVFEELTAGYCSFEMSSDVAGAIGDAAATALTGTGDSAISVDNFVETVGTWVGDFEQSIGAFILICFVSFIVGFIYLIVLRFTVGFCVWLSVVLAFVFLILGAYLCIVRSFQCSGSSLFDTGLEGMVALASSAEALVNTAVSGESSDENCYDENGVKDAGNCEGYTGVQMTTVSGNRCDKWGQAAENLLPRMYTVANSAQWNLFKDGTETSGEKYCRNPLYPGTLIRGQTIWCWTLNPDKPWEECRPVGVIFPECENGYAVETEELRTVLLICGYVILGLAGLYLIAVCCFANRIRLAIAVNKVATLYVGQTPLIILLPVVQALVCTAWTLVWCLSATFLLSQVPADRVPSTTFVSYAEAYGTSTVAGKCTGEWPQGMVWKDEEGCVENDDGVFGCWKCAPPRFSFDWRFWVSYFVFLWNTALNVAVGQCVIAGSVGVWFFTANQEKGSKPSIRQALRNAFRYHLGSLAFGAFIIAVIQLIRTLMKYYEEQAKAQKNRIVVLILKVCQCIMWCLEKCVQYLNKNAYIQIALMGTNFCTSAKKAFFLILRNAIRFGTVAILGAVIEKIGLFFITGLTTGLGYMIFSAMHPDLAPVVPVFIYFMLGYVVARLFTSVFSMAVDTTLQCFLACEEMELAVAGPEGFVPGPLESWLDTTKKAEDVEIKEGDNARA